jgi:hypothetical protein
MRHHSNGQRVGGRSDDPAGDRKNLAVERRDGPLPRSPRRMDADHPPDRPARAGGQAAGSRKTDDRVGVAAGGGRHAEPQRRAHEPHRRLRRARRGRRAAGSAVLGLTIPLRVTAAGARHRARARPRPAENDRARAGRPDAAILRGARLRGRGRLQVSVDGRRTRDGPPRRMDGGRGLAGRAALA